MSETTVRESTQLENRQPHPTQARAQSKESPRPTGNGSALKPIKRTRPNGSPCPNVNEKPKRKPIDWMLIWQRSKYYAVVFAIRVLMLMIYLTVIREGMTALFDVFAVKLHRLPLLSWMVNDAFTYDLDLATVAALGVFSAVCFSSQHAIRLLVIGDDNDLLGGSDDLSNRREFLTIGLACGLMFVDIVLLYMSVAESDWGGGGFSFKAAVVSVLYAFVLVGMTLMMLQLKSQLVAFERKRGVRS